MGIFDTILESEHLEESDIQSFETLSKCISVGEKVLRICVGKREPQKHDMVIISLFRKVIEQADGVFILLDHESNSALTSSFRSLYETSVGLQFILQDDKVLHKRAISYYVSYLHELISFMKKAIQTGELDTLYTREKLSSNIKIYEETLKEDELLPVHEMWKIKKKHNKGYPPKWYSLYGNTSNFTQLAKAFKGTNPMLYAGYSLESHGYNALESIVYNDEEEKHLLAPLRFRNQKNETLCKQTVSITNLCTVLMIRRYCPEYFPDFQDFYAATRPDF